ISSIDATEFPYLRLRMRNIDSVTLTPYQLKYWRVHFDPVPEGALAANLFFSSKDTLEAGEVLKFGIAFKNISKNDFDSLSVRAVLTDMNNVPHNLDMLKYPPLISGDTIVVRFETNVEHFPGNN